MGQNLTSALGNEQLDHKPSARQGSRGKVDFTLEEYVCISESSEFKSLVKKKNKFIVPISVLFLGLYILLPILTSFTTVLDGKAFGDITWVWIYSIGLFIMTWVLCMTYVKKAASFDGDAQKIIGKAKDGGY